MAITCLEMGSRAIGNQMFEFAALFGIGKRLGIDIKIPYCKPSIHQPTGQSIISIKDIFNISIFDLTEEERLQIQFQYVEKRKEFNPEIFGEVKNWTNLVGFFMSEEYFQDCILELRQQLTIKETWINLAQEQFNKLFGKTNITHKDCAFLHVRRGDYCLQHLQPFHPLLPIEYYKRALDIVLKKNSYTRILVFSDDIEFCKKVFSPACYFIDNSEFLEYSNVIDFTMMTLCKQASILANSTFSYWSAWIANNDLTIYPSIFLGPSYNWYNPIKNENWIKI